jgi:ribosomal protein L32
MFKTVSEQVKQERLDICKGCDEFSSALRSCKQCGCYMPAKAMFANSTCPLNKWAESEPGTDLINKLEEMILASWNKE